MKSLALFVSLIALASSLPVKRTVQIKREVPQEHSHDGILNSTRIQLQKNNPDGIVDVVFGLLGDAAASQGQGKITDTDCLQQAIADQAFTNAKVDGDIDGMVAALQFRALERNTGKVGLASVACTSIQATNPEIAAIQQHQDPASPNATAINKGIALEVARQIASIGGDPQLALKTGTFAPGNVNDPTGAGNTCDDQESGEGCIFSKNLIVFDATADEINAAVAGISTGSGVGGAGAAVANPTVSTSIVPSATGTACSLVTVTMTMTVDAVETTSPTTTATEAPAAATTTSAAVATSTTSTSTTTSGTNLQTFTGALGGITAPAVTSGGTKGFVTDNSDFVNLSAALGRSCDVQHNECANKANSGGQDFTVGDCDQQDTECKAAGGSS